MRVLKYRDITRLTLYGRYDKNVNDATSIYSGYDRALTTTTGGGINAITISNGGTVGFTSAPNVYILLLLIFLLLIHLVIIIHSRHKQCQFIILNL